MNDKKEQSQNSEHKTRILVVDDHAIVRQGLIKLVNEESDLVVCAEVGNADEALEAFKEQQVDLAIVDISLKGTNGLELTKRMKLHYPNLNILILSMHDGLLYAQRSLQAGASGYVAKHEAPETIITAIRQVLSGKIYVSDSNAVRMLSDAAPDNSEGLDQPNSISLHPR